MRFTRRKVVAGALAAASIGGLVANQAAKAAPTPQFLTVTGTGVGGGPHVKMFTNDGVERASFMAYDPLFRGGVNVAVGDLDGDGLAEIITGAGPGGGAHVRVFSESGVPIDEVSFFAYPSAFRGGVNVAVSDVDGDGDDEVITAPASGGGPHIKVFNFDENDGVSLEREFFAYDTSFLGGVSVAGAYVDTSDNEGIVVGAGPGGGPHVKTFTASGGLVGSWFAYNTAYRGGVEVGGAFEDGDEIEEILTSSAAGPGHVRSFDVNGAPRGLNFYAYPGTNRGADIASIEQSPGPFVVAPWGNGTPTGVSGRDGDGNPTSLNFNPYPGFGGGIKIATGFLFFDSDPSVTTSSSSTTSSSTTSSSTSSTSTSTTSTSTTTSTTTP